MQTFLPYESFASSAYCLDVPRLGKQRVECWQILSAIRDTNYGWQNHPCVRMWRPYQQALIEYALHICGHWRRLGYKDTLYDRFLDLSDISSYVKPLWLGDERLHLSHQAQLYRKDPSFYYAFADVPYQPYYWPE